MRGARTEAADGGFNVVLDVDPGLTVRDFRDGNRIAIDLSPKPPETSDGAPADGQETSDAQASAETNQPLEAPAGPKAGSDAAAVLKTDGAATAETSAQTPAHTEGASAASSTASSAPASTAGAAAAPPSATDAATATAATPPPAAAQDAGAQSGADASPSAAAQAPAPAAEPALGFVAGKDGADIVLPWTNAVPASIFRRGGTLWLVFETDAPLTATQPGPDVSYLFGAVEQSSADGVEIVRIEIKGDAVIGVRLDDARWSVHVGENAGAPPASIEPVRESDTAGGTRLRFALNGKGSTGSRIRPPAITWSWRPRLGPCAPSRAPRSSSKWRPLRARMGSPSCPSRTISKW